MKELTLQKNENIFSKNYKEHILDIDNIKSIDVISTNNISLDKALGCNGIPKGRITEIFGNESSGKTTLTLELVKSVQEKGGKTLFLDFEGSIDLNYLKKINIDFSKLVIAQPTYGEIGFGMIEEALINNSFDLIVVDSVAAMSSIVEQEAKIEESSIIGSQARMMSRGIRRIQTLLYNSNTAIVFINQIREKIGVFFGNNETTPGGRALRFFSSIRLEVKKVELIKNGNDKIGVKSKISVVKNKLGKPYVTTFMNIFFNEGFDKFKEIINYAVENEIIKRSGSWFYFNEERLVQGMNNLIAYYKENPERFKEIEEIVIKTSV